MFELRAIGSILVENPNGGDYVSFHTARDMGFHPKSVFPSHAILLVIPSDKFICGEPGRIDRKFSLDYAERRGTLDNQTLENRSENRIFKELIYFHARNRARKE